MSPVDTVKSLWGTLVGKPTRYIKDRALALQDNYVFLFQESSAVLKTSGEAITAISSIIHNWEAAQEIIAKDRAARVKRRFEMFPDVEAWLAGKKNKSSSTPPKVPEKDHSTDAPKK